MLTVRFALVCSADKNLLLISSPMARKMPSIEMLWV
jgi:hypothetical protein